MDVFPAVFWAGASPAQVSVEELTTEHTEFTEGWIYKPEPFALSLMP